MCPVGIGCFGDGEVVGGEEDGGYAILGEEFSGEGGGVGGPAGEVLDVGGGGAGRGEKAGTGEEFQGVFIGCCFGLDEEGAPVGVREGVYGSAVGGAENWLGDEGGARDRGRGGLTVS